MIPHFCFFLVCQGFDNTSSNLMDPKKKSIQLILLSSYLNCSMKMTLKSIKLLSEFFWNAGKKTWIENVAGQSLICLNWTVFIKGPSTFSLCQLTRTTVLSHNQPVKLLIRADFEGTTGASVLSHPKKKRKSTRLFESENFHVLVPNQTGQITFFVYFQCPI